MGGDIKVLSKETLLSLATKMQCITFEIATTVHSVPPLNHIVCLLLFTFL